MTFHPSKTGTPLTLAEARPAPPPPSPPPPPQTRSSRPHSKPTFWLCAVQTPTKKTKTKGPDLRAPFPGPPPPLPSAIFDLPRGQSLWVKGLRRIACVSACGIAIRTRKGAQEGKHRSARANRDPPAGARARRAPAGRWFPPQGYGRAQAVGGDTEAPLNAVSSATRLYQDWRRLSMQDSRSSMA